MVFGDIVIASFPFTNEISFKARPAVVLGASYDEYNDVILCMISSVIPKHLNDFQILINPSSNNGLRAVSVLKVHKIATVEQDRILSKIGILSENQLIDFSNKFKKLATF